MESQGDKLHTKDKRQRPSNSPTNDNQERRPEEGKLNTEIDRPGISEYVRVLVSVENCLSEVITKGDDSIS
jgi:hypothetical protein